MDTATNQSKSDGLGGAVFEFPAGVKRSEPAPEIVSKTPKMNLTQHLPEGNFKNYVEDVAKMCEIPKNTSLLIGLGIVSSVASRAYAVSYPNGKALPLGEYITCSQPPGTGKSRMLEAYQYPIFNGAKGSF